MACLSIVNDNTDEKRPPTVVANPIFILSQSDTELIFEVLEKDATGLKGLLDQTRFFYIDGLFWARLETLEKCVSTQQSLRDRPTLRGRFTVFGDRSQRD